MISAACIGKISVDAASIKGQKRASQQVTTVIMRVDAPTLLLDGGCVMAPATTGWSSLSDDPFVPRG